MCVRPRCDLWMYSVSVVTGICTQKINEYSIFNLGNTANYIQRYFCMLFAQQNVQISSSKSSSPSSSSSLMFFFFHFSLLRLCLCVHYSFAVDHIAQRTDTTIFGHKFTIYDSPKKRKINETTAETWKERNIFAAREKTQTKTLFTPCFFFEIVSVALWFAIAAVIRCPIRWEKLLKFH